MSACCRRVWRLEAHHAAGTLRGRDSDSVLQQQPRQPAELPQIVAHQGEAFAAGVGGNVQIVDADGLTFAFQSGSDLAIVLGRFGPIGEHFETAAEVLHHRQIAALLATLFAAMQQFRQGDRGDRHMAGVAIEAAQKLLRPSLDHVDADVGVEQIAEHRLIQSDSRSL